jgi:hypothetical protein
MFNHFRFIGCILYVLGLESVSYFPIAGAMVGILLQMVVTPKEENIQNTLYKPKTYKIHPLNLKHTKYTL